MLVLKDLLAMSSPLRLATITALTSLLFAQPSIQQTYTDCNPTQSGSCPPNAALGSSVSVDFTSGQSDAFTSQGGTTYDSNGASFTVASSGDSPQIISNWYIMFGKMEVTVKAAPGAGIVSSAVLQSDDLDEIDWEWLGARNDEVQSNFFGKGQTTSWNRGAIHAVDGTQDEFHTYTIDWNENQIVWQIDGTTVRVLKEADVPDQYPQTPCQVRIGAWSGGDPGNPQGTIDWAMGPTDYSGAPYTMVVQSLSVTDYSTGEEYSYGDRSGDWTSIQSKGGAVNGNAGADGPTDTDDADVPMITQSSNGNVVPWSGTHADTPEPTFSDTTYPGLPSGWTVDPTSGKVVPPSAAPTTFLSASSTSSPSAPSPAPFCTESGYEVVSSFDERGFPVTNTIAAGVSTGWDDRGFPTTAYPSNCPTAGVPYEAGGQRQATRDVSADRSDGAGELAVGSEGSSTNGGEDGEESGGARMSGRGCVGEGVVLLAGCVMAVLFCS